MLTVGSLFAGIGGFDLGLERAGMETVWQVEIDDYCQRVLAKHWPDVERFSDVRECGAHNLKPVDLVCGGFPCQPVSHAGKRKGDADKRWLWPEFARVVRELKPRWVLAENVPGLLSIDDGRLFGTVLGDLAALGYAVEWECIPAAAVGAPHIRDRLWIIAHAQHTNADLAGLHRTTTDSHGQGCEVQPADKQGGVTGPIRQAVADANRGRQQECPQLDGDTLHGATDRNPQGQHVGRCGDDVAHADSVLSPEPRRTRAGRAESCDGSLSLPGRDGADYWAVEPRVGRVASRVPARVDRLRALGNAVVPQVVEWIGRRIVEADAE